MLKKSFLVLLLLTELLASKIYRINRKSIQKSKSFPKALRIEKIISNQPDDDSSSSSYSAITSNTLDSFVLFDFDFDDRCNKKETTAQLIAEDHNEIFASEEVTKLNFLNKIFEPNGADDEDNDAMAGSQAQTH